MPAPRDASTPITGVGRDAARTSVAAILAYLAGQVLPPEIAPQGAFLALVVLSAGFAGLGKMAREKGWTLGAVI